MAEETVDLIEETEEEINNWMYYTNEPTREECSDLNTFADVENDQRLIYIDYTSQVVNNNEQVFEYEPDDNLINKEENLDPEDNVHQVENATDNEDDTTKHSLILKETIDENGQLVEEYYCQHCNISFSNIDDFFSYHPSMELLNDNTTQEQQQNIVQTVTKDKLWDLVENLEESKNDDEIIENVIEYKPNITQQNCDSLQYDSVELENERYFCYDCQQVFGDLITAENHDCADHLQSTENISETKSNLLVDNTDNNVYRCNLCVKDYVSLRSFNNHQRMHKKSENPLGHIATLRDDPIVCEICNTIFSSEKNLKLHMKMHKKHVVKTIQEALPVGAQDEYNELSQFFCEICNKSFDQKLLVIHKNMHQNLEEYCCGKCNKQFENLPSYEIHMQMHVDNEMKSKKVFAIKKNIGEDSPSTSGGQGGGKRKHACQYCGKEFLRPYEKVKHERIHTGEKPYECEVCGKTFRVTYSLTLHLRTHTDIRPYICATCNKRFKQQSVYVHHLKTHIVERGYKCEVCGKSFRTSVQLSGHKNIHSKPYNCTECNRPFASLYAVKTHMKTHNKGHKANKNLKNRCSICGASYARLFALRYHIKEQHGIEVDPTKLLAENDTNTHNEMDAETALLMNVAHEASNQEINFINADDEEVDEDERAVNEDLGIYNNQVDHEENIQNSLPNNVYLDETEAATQAILNTEEISVDHFSNEEIITDWLSK